MRRNLVLLYLRKRRQDPAGVARSSLHVLDTGLTLDQIAEPIADEIK